MDIINKLKSLVLSGALALSKAEKDVLTEIITKGSADINKEEHIQKHEIKILSEARFYQLLNRADQYINKRDEGKLKLMLESRGFQNIDQIFENKQYSSVMDNSINPTIEYKFKTDNGLYRYSNVLHVKNNGDGKELKFFVNLKEFPHVINHINELSDLTYFEIEDKLKQYAYNITQFNGSEKMDNNTLSLNFSGKVLLDGETLIDENNTEIRVLTTDDIIDPGTIYFAGF